MSTHDLYVQDPGDRVWQVPASGAARFSWEYDDGRDRLLALYQKGKDKQWDGQQAHRLGPGGRPVRPARHPRRGHRPLRHARTGTR